LHGQEWMQPSGILIRRNTAELVVPLLDRALAHVLDVAVPQSDPEEWEESLAQARADLFAAVNAICTKYPDLDSSQEPDSETLTRHGGLFERERQAAAEFLSSSAALEECAALKAALPLVDRAADILHGRDDGPELIPINQRLSDARACILLGLTLLRDP